MEPDLVQVIEVPTRDHRNEVVIGDVDHGQELDGMSVEMTSGRAEYAEGRHTRSPGPDRQQDRPAAEWRPSVIVEKQRLHDWLATLPRASRQAGRVRRRSSDAPPKDAGRSTRQDRLQPRRRPVRVHS
jgi:hypothetical protein